MHIRFLGVNELVGELAAMQARVDFATVEATKKAQRVMVASVKSRMRGAPRANHRGRSSVYAVSVTVGGPKKRSRAGGPGKFTGLLASGVGGKKKVVSVGGIVKGGVGVGGARMRANNLKKRKIEAKYPFFEPGIHAAEAKLGALYALAWKAAIDKKGGI